MRAALLYGKNDLRVETADFPELKPNQVLIQTHACGVCPSDTRLYTGEEAPPPPGRKLPPFLTIPRIPGHEWGGTIVEVGEKVKDWKPGDRVVIDGTKPCGVCYFCQHGLFTYCYHPQFLARGGMCEYGVAADTQLYRVADHVSFEDASFCEPLSCCINGIHQANINVGEDVVVIGVGQIGLMHIQLAKLRSARVIAVDLIPSRLEVAAKLGADVIIDSSKEDAAQKVLDLTDGRGADAVMLAVGAMPVAELGIKLVRIGGTVVFFASTFPLSAAILPLNMNDLHRRQIFLTGARGHNPDDFRVALKLITEGTVKVEPLISHRLPLEETKRGFDITVGREGLKVIIQVK